MPERIKPITLAGIPITTRHLAANIPSKEPRKSPADQMIKAHFTGDQ